MADIDTHDERAAIFERHRARLFGIGYRMLGSVEDAEDIVQEAYLRWHQAAIETVRSAEAWLVAVVTRLAIDRLRRSTTEREAYEGSWLPEPLAMAPAPDREAELASDLSMAFLVLLERLAPEERAAFLLREVFGADYAEIAHVLERSETACRQVVHRARARVRNEKRRVTAPVETHEQIVERFMAALAAEDKDALVALFTDDVLLMSDGGGRAPSIRNVVSGAERVAQVAVGYQRKGRGLITHRLAWINGEPAVLTLADGRTLFTTSFAIEDGRIAAVYRVLNPDKLGHVGPPPFPWDTVRG
ncbi:MAG TPA: RNA polymerase sigma factor SigJ [Gemmatimonadaceae bacterium]|nr:RNA polymerase sigma factor SigJ [Gemmatimonadaceae bacterium]